MRRIYSILTGGCLGLAINRGSVRLLSGGVLALGLLLVDYLEEIRDHQPDR